MMWIFSFYRLYFSVAAGAAAGVLSRSVWAGIAAAVTVRALWFGVEYLVERLAIDRSFKKHISLFKQELGPYGIRIANRAESNMRVKKSLCEVFTPDPARLAKAVEQLDVMDALFKAGIRPDADEFLLHDLKLKYGKLRLEREKKQP